MFLNEIFSGDEPDENDPIELAILQVNFQGWAADISE